MSTFPETAHRKPAAEPGGPGGHLSPSTCGREGRDRIWAQFRACLKLMENKCFKFKPFKGQFSLRPRSASFLTHWREE